MIPLSSTHGLHPPFSAGRRVVALADSTAQGLHARARAAQIAQELAVPLDVLPAGAGLGRLAPCADAALLVLPHRPGRAVAGCLWGTLAERAVRSLALPTLVVVQPAAAGYRRVLVPVSLDGHEALLIDAAGRLSRDARLRVLHVVDRGLESSLWLADAPEAALRAQRQRRSMGARAALDRAIAQAGAHSRAASIVSFGDAAPRVIESARAAHAQLVVIGQRPRSRLERLFTGSLAAHVIAEGGADVLLLPLQGRTWRPGGAGVPAYT